MKPPFHRPTRVTPGFSRPESPRPKPFKRASLRDPFPGKNHGFPAPGTEPSGLPAGSKVGVGIQRGVGRPSGVPWFSGPGVRTTGVSEDKEGVGDASAAPALAEGSAGDSPWPAPGAVQRISGVFPSTSFRSAFFDSFFK